MKRNIHLNDFDMRNDLLTEKTKCHFFYFARAYW